MGPLGDFQTPYGEPVSIVRDQEHVGIEYTIDGQHGFIWLDDETTHRVAVELLVTRDELVATKPTPGANSAPRKEIP